MCKKLYDVDVVKKFPASTDIWEFHYVRYWNSIVFKFGAEEITYLGKRIALRHDVKSLSDLIDLLVRMETELPKKHCVAVSQYFQLQAGTASLKRLSKLKKGD